jgi:hypothetical protein
MVTQKTNSQKDQQIFNSYSIDEKIGKNSNIWGVYPSSPEYPVASTPLGIAQLKIFVHPTDPEQSIKSTRHQWTER